ncbi:MAG: hypothetical protein LKI72_04265 [Prevotella sp.]|jgi:predicted transcriptional regulator of viral defense system|nr:hypothetical protein [Prevotella sp.]MCH4250983.1 hypothetical protein [Prevotella sp.]MCI1685169.1 hypothetical protein [Prevotella sp.]MCI1816390.1 hypothetical protein [Prevotella sp.]MCI2179359.1 hypothetical protein [Prevotella sp.]
MENNNNVNQFLSSSRYKEKGRTAYYRMLTEVHKGELVRIRRGVYASKEQLADTMIDLEVVIPKGILCLYSAWSIHGLTTSMPQAYHVAIKRGRKIVLPEYPGIELYHISEDLLEIGVEQKIVSGYEVKVYNAERSVCDAVKFRNKVGMDICSEVVNSYLDSPERNLSLLMDYAQKMRVANILSKYLEIKL